ncbi:CHAT domain-containing tetratricopeptide repeat protein, partial [Iningainema tapete]
LAEQWLKRDLIIREKALGHEHPSVAKSLDDLIRLYKDQKNYQLAEQWLKRDLIIREKALGHEHPSVATSVNKLAQLYHEQRKYQLAEPLYKRSLVIREKVLRPEHLDVATSVDKLALLYHEQRNYQLAEPLYKRSLVIREKALSQEHPDVATSIENLARLYQNQRNYQLAEPLYKRALEIREKALGQSHSDVTSSIKKFVQQYKDQGNYQLAEQWLKRDLEIREKALGQEHLDVATSVDNLAQLYQDQGKYQFAEQWLKRALEIREKALGQSHPDVATSVDKLAQLYQYYQRNYQLAEPLYKRALAIREKALGQSHYSVTWSVEKLAQLYKDQGNYQLAEQWLKRDLAIKEKALGQSHPGVLTSVSNLARLYEDQGNYQLAEPLLKRCLEIIEAPPQEPFDVDVAVFLSRLAIVYYKQRNYQLAEPLFKRSLEIFEKILSQNSHLSLFNIFVIRLLNNFTLLYLAQGNVARAIDLLQNLLEIEEKELVDNFARNSEQSKQIYMNDVKYTTTNPIISLALQEARNNSTAAQLAVTTVLRHKGRVLDAMADSVQILRSQLANKPELLWLFDEWLSVLQQQSALEYKEKTILQQNKDTFSQLEAQRQKLEEKISKRSAEFRKTIQPVELSAIQAKIPKDAAIIEIVQYQPFNAKAQKHSETWGNPRYAAVVIRSSGEPKWVDLGEASAIDKSVANLRKTLPNPSLIASAHEVARKLDEQIMTPIRPYLGDAHHLLLSPDGQLTLIPFEALRDKEGKYLIERYAFSYLTSGRDLLQLDSSASNSTPVVFAGVDYDQMEITAATTDRPNNHNLRSTDLASLKFGALAATTEEAQKIKAIFPNTKVLLGKQATETAIKKLSTPSILHLATHGFFFQDIKLDLPTELVKNLQQPPQRFQQENPLLRAGLALAGINNRHTAQAFTDDGVLTALEVAGLDLHGTQLVVLSACKTGLGDVKVGEGLYGLRRALVMAGSQSQILSLWVVDDTGTKDLMVKYYQGLKAGKGRHQALREAQLELLSDPRYTHPYYWASFVPSGDWTPLRLK